MGSEHLPTIARIGMRVITRSLDNGNDYLGTICQMFEDCCVVRLDNPRDDSEGDAPNVAAVTWDNVDLVDVQPDPTEVTPASGAPAVAPLTAGVCPGMRVRIPIGDGNDDREGAVVAALPECCVVRLDEKVRYAGRHAAADWSLVTVLNLSPAGGKPVSRATRRVDRKK